MMRKIGVSARKLYVHIYSTFYDNIQHLLLMILMLALWKPLDNVILRAQT